MRQALKQLLYRHYPGLYRQATLPVTESCMGRGICCNDGWFALIDALSETIMAIHPECQAAQVKEKIGTLRFYFDGRYEALNLVVGAAEIYSSRICDRTGAPGDLMKTASRYPLVATLSAEGIELLNACDRMTRVFEPMGEEFRMEPGVFSSAETFQLPVASVRRSWSRTEAISILRKRHEYGLAAGCLIDIPKGGFDLADAVMLKVYRRFRSDYDLSGASIPKISRVIWGDASGMSLKFDEASIPVAARLEIDCMEEWQRPPEKPILEIEIAKLRRSLAGVCLFAKNMSMRVDHSTGRTGPVDDDGRLRI